MKHSIYKLLRKAAEDPVRFCEKFWPGGEPWQLAVMDSVHKFRRTTVVSCNGAGKTWVGARAIAWFLLTHPGSIVITTAGTWAQVRRQLWKEIITARNQLPKAMQIGKVSTVSWDLANEWYGIGASTYDPQHFEGYHARYIMIVVDEGKSVKQGIFDAINRIFAGNSEIVRLLVLSSPGNASGAHYDSHNAKAELYSRIKVSPFEAYQETPEGIHTELPPTRHLTEEYIEEMKAEYGEGTPLYESMVCANWMADGEDRLFSSTTLRDSRDKSCTESKRNPTMKGGADVARSTDGDYNVLQATLRWEEPDGYHYEDVAREKFHTRDANVFEDRLKKFCLIHKISAENMSVDGTGIGGPCCDHLRKDGFPVVEVQFGSSAEMETPMLADMRSQLWWNGATIAREGRLHGLEDERTKAQLGETKYFFDGGGRIRAESKEAIRIRMKKERPRSPWKSPDEADAFLLSIHEPRVTRVTLLTDLGLISQSKQAEDGGWWENEAFSRDH